MIPSGALPPTSSAGDSATKAPSLTRRRRRRPASLVALAIVIASCGGESSPDATDAALTSSPESTDGDAPPTSEAIGAEVTEPIDTEPAATEPVATEPVETEPVATEPVVTATWEGGDFLSLVDARMDEIAAVFGQPLSADAVAPIVEIPNDFPYPDGTVVGVTRAFERDSRVTDEIRISDERIVGVDSPVDATDFAATLDALAADLPPDGPSRWSLASNQRDSFVNTLFVADAADGSDRKDRLVLGTRTELSPGEPSWSVNFEVAATEIPEPSWLAGLPIVEGGELVTLREGRGVVVDFGRPAEDGFIEVRHLYPLERYDDLEAFFESGIIAAAGFRYEDTPFSNLDIRIDVSNGDWEGTVGVGTLNVNNEDVGYQLIWTLTRPA